VIGFSNAIFGQIQKKAVGPNFLHFFVLLPDKRRKKAALAPGAWPTREQEQVTRWRKRGVQNKSPTGGGQNGP
jgi:hypothetical protein